MKNISCNNFIICLGDDVRYRFAQELMPEGHLIDSNSLRINVSYIFIHSELENVITDEKKVLVYTNKVADGRIVEFPVSGIDLKSAFADQESIKIGKAVIFADFPYKKENLRYLIEKTVGSAKNADIDVILYNEQRRAGYTDIERSERIIAEAYSEFGSYGVEIYEYSSGAVKSEFFTVRPDNLRYLKRKYKKELKAAKYRVDNRFDIHFKTFLERTYEHYFSINNPTEFSRYLKLFEFSSLPIDTDDIIGSFVLDFKDMYLGSESDIPAEISEFYLDYISELLSFRLDEESEMIKKYAVTLFDNMFAEHKKLSSGKSELEYKEVLNRNNVITEFTIVVDDYFHRQLPNLLHSMAVAKIKSVQKMIDNKE